MRRLPKAADMVDICLPTYMHCEYTLEGRQGGLNVVCEKPMSHKLAEAKKMVTAVRKANIKFMCAHVIRFWPEYILLKEYVARRSWASCSPSLCIASAQADVDVGELDCEGRLSGGALADLHVHDADFVRYLCGEPKGVDTVATKHKGDGLDYVFTNYYYRTWPSARKRGWNLPSSFGFFMAYRAVFEKGSLEFDMLPETHNHPLHGRWQVSIPSPAAPRCGRSDGRRHISSLGGYYNELKYFVECVEKRRSQDGHGRRLLQDRRAPRSRGEVGGEEVE